MDEVRGEYRAASQHAQQTSGLCGLAVLHSWACWPQGLVSLSHGPAGWRMPSCHGHPVPKPRRHPPLPPTPRCRPRHCDPGLECLSNLLRASRGSERWPRRLGLLGLGTRALSSTAKRTHGPLMPSLARASSSEHGLVCLSLPGLSPSSPSFPSPSSPLSPLLSGSRVMGRGVGGCKNNVVGGGSKGLRTDPSGL